MTASYTFDIFTSLDGNASYGNPGDWGRLLGRAGSAVGRVRVHRPWVAEPGMWWQYDFGDGPLIEG